MDGGGSGRGHREKRTTWRTSPPPPTPTFFFSSFAELSGAMISRWECGGDGRNKRDSCREREMGEIKREMGGEREEEQKPGERPAMERQERRNKGSGRAEADGGEDDEVLTCGQSGQVVGEDGRAFETLVATPPISLQSGIFLRCRLIINKQPPIRSG